MPRRTHAKAWATAPMLAIGVFLGLPMVSESTTNACLALERHVAGRLADLDDGRGAQLTAMLEYPAMPPALSCSYIYWRAFT